MNNVKLEYDIIKICKNLFEQHIEFIFEESASIAINNWNFEYGFSKNYQKEKEEFIKHFLNQL